METKEVVKHTYKVVPVGNGDLYGWNEYDEQGKVVRSSEQHWPSEADAEKAIRTITTDEEIVEVVTIKNINPDANTNVNLVKDPQRVKDENAGMTVVSKGIEEIAEDKARPAKARTAARKPSRKAKVAKVPADSDNK